METKNHFENIGFRLRVFVRVMVQLFAMVFLVSFVGCKSGQLQNDTDGFVQIFDGKTLDDWEGDPVYWRVEDGKLVGEVTPETILDRNSFIIWRGGEVDDFELKVEYRVSRAGNSGINYRSHEIDGLPYALMGYQADINGTGTITGSNYEERRRTTIASQSEKTVLNRPTKNPEALSDHIERNRWVPTEVVGSLGTSSELRSHLKKGDWNAYHLIVKGNRLKHYVNGKLMSDVTDNDQINRSEKGLLGVQVHVGPPMKIEYKNFRLKTLK
ncbi:DUF1080 domain-containing protein [Arenibacter sp. ARW7G5Y1]|uniref:3-keto-disaccharide hydrolase n=1 Tax=Arenibacter sp. ARW7G5Y1 TaxID=2135619 RepID=UPI000D8AEEE4|nr:DUF1080 domain-containing protein [Arenibacter sp. ARW7G5Y1]PXX23714.1 uncharacterized protein DUF1080 [Arenibacter sp. ARW7G5Y1]